MIRNTGYRSIVICLVLLSMLATGGQASHAALLDGMLDTVEESLAERLATHNERLTTGNFYTDGRPNAHGPVGMMGDHTHEEGEVMFSYRVMHMWMHGTRFGTSRVSDADVVRPPNAMSGPSGYVVVPESMRMIMHMVGFMYGWNDTVTLTAMVPYTHVNMNHRVRDSGMTPPPDGVRGETFTTRSEGVGDIRLGSLWRLWAVEAPSLGAHRFHANLAISVPTGSIEPVDHTPLSQHLARTMGSDPNVRLPYPMHLGSGTVDWYPGITYGGEKGRVSWGVQTIGTLRTGRNSNGFSKGDAYVVNVHGAYEVLHKLLSGSVRLSWNHWNAYDGADPDITTHAPFGPRLVQTAFPDLLGGQRLDILGGVNILLPETMGFETRLAVEGGVPVYQYLDGQLETDSIVTFGWQALY